MRHFWVATLFVVLAFIACGASASESYGHPSELRGVSKVFVDTDGEVDLRDIIVATLKKRLPEVSVVEESSDAEVIIAFRYARDAFKSDDFDGRLVVKRVSGSKIRYIASYRHDESELDDLAEEITLRLVKEFKSVAK